MKRPSKAIVLFFGFIIVFALVAAAQEKAADDAVTCAVSGKTMKKSEAKGMYEYKGKTYYFCCDGCKEAFIKAPEKYTQKEAQEGQMPAHDQDKEGHMHGVSDADSTVVDPVCGMKIKKSEAKATYEYNGNTYYFCMEGCLEKFKKDPEKYAQKTEEMVTCAVSGKTIKKSEATGKYEYNGKTYYFCCPDCQEKFVKEPEKYTKKDAGMGTEPQGCCAACAVKKTQ